MKKIKVLLLSGKLTTEHNFVEMNGYLRTILEATGRFTVRVVEEFNGATERMLEGYDMILLNYDGKDVPTDSYERWEPGAESVFFNFVKNGGGLFIHHSCIWLEDDLPEEYHKLWGYYATMPQSRKVPKDDFLVQVRSEDPIVAGLSDFIVVGDDHFAGLVKAEGTEPEVLLTAYDDIKNYQVSWWPPKHHPVEIPGGKLENMRGVNTDTPLAWKHSYGKGRVAAFSVGHGIDTYRRIDWVTVFARAAEWAGSGEVTLPRPDRTGANRFLEWPYYGS